MIKFFRKIRYDLMGKNKTRKYFRYAIGEIILVVIGILIALQINNWNEKRKLNNLKQNYYQQILTDLEDDKNYAQYAMHILDSSQTIYNNYNKTFKTSNLPTSEIFQNMFENDFSIFTVQFNSTTIKSLITNGDIKLLDTELHNNLIKYNGEKERLLVVRKSNTDYALDILKNVMMDGGNFNLNSKLQNQSELAKVINIENRYPELFIKIEAYLGWKEYAEKKTIDGLKQLIEEINITTELVSSELEK